MRWFEGDVVAAIAETKRLGALFVVYIQGGKEAESQHMCSLWDAVDAEKDLPWASVAVKLVEGSTDAKNFAQIYPIPCFPATYFIDGNGKPTNVVLFNKIESMDAAKFREALPRLVFPLPGKEATSGLTRKDGSAPPPVVAAAPAAAAAAPVAAPVAAAAAPTTSSAEEIAEKIKRAKELLEKKKAADEEKKSKEELAKETQRREEAKEMHRFAEERRNKELLEAAAARRKDKLESAKERERVKEQIKADKAERDARFRSQQSQQQSPADEEKRGIAPPQAVASDRCRIQVRFPDGSTALHDFPSVDALASLRQIVAADARVRGIPFRLAQPAPRRVYAENEMDKTFLDLALTPASTLLVLTDSAPSPSTRLSSATSAAVQPAYNPMTTLISFVTYIIWTPIQFVLSLVGMGGGGGVREGEQKKRDDPPAPSAAASHAAGDSAASAAGAAARRRHQGGSNIHTLGAANDDSEQSAEDDQDANWNGNSTQFL